MEQVANDPGLLDHVQAWSAFATVFVAGIGLLGVYYTLRKDRREERIGVAPYIRVDIYPAVEGLGDFAAPTAYYETDSSLVDLAEGLANDSTATFAAFFRNYQPHDLGIAFRVAAFFVLEARSDTDAIQYHYSVVTIPYVERDKPVKLQLFRIPKSWRVTVWLTRLAFSDFYDEFHEHSEGSNENALHGRLTCVYDGSIFRSIPEGRPAGRWGIR